MVFMGETFFFNEINRQLTEVGMMMEYNDATRQKIVRELQTDVCDAENIGRANILTFRHRASSIQDRHFTTLQRTLFICLINKYISLSDICLTVNH